MILSNLGQWQISGFEGVSKIISFYLSGAICWGTWKVRIKIIFEDKFSTQDGLIFFLCLGFYLIGSLSLWSLMRRRGIPLVCVCLVLFTFSVWVFFFALLFSSLAFHPPSECFLCLAPFLLSYEFATIPKK